MSLQPLRRLYARWKTVINSNKASRATLNTAYESAPLVYTTAPRATMSTAYESAPPVYTTIPRATISTAYESAPLVYTGGTNIRLLEFLPYTPNSDGEPMLLQFKFHVFFLASQPKYTAISYTWGCDAKTSNILLNGKEFAVRNNLYELLNTLAESEIGLFWVDAICIDQTNVSERNHQVGLMGEIYFQADTVIVWLDSAHKGTIDGLNALQNQCGIFTPKKITGDFTIVGPPRITPEPRLDELRPRELDHILTLCNNPYWSRAWIVQELVLAREAQIRCGKEEFRLEQLADLVQHLRHYSKTFLPRDLEAKDSILNSPAAKVIAKRKKWQNSSGRSYVNPWDTPFEILGCSDVRDRVYAMTALMDSALAIVPDYNKTPAEIFEGIFEQYIKRNGTFVGAIWNLQSMLELADNEPIVQRARKFGSLEWNPLWNTNT